MLCDKHSALKLIDEMRVLCKYNLHSDNRKNTKLLSLQITIRSFIE